MRGCGGLVVDLLKEEDQLDKLPSYYIFVAVKVLVAIASLVITIVRAAVTNLSTDLLNKYFKALYILAKSARC
jgi:RNase P/RNase MRP subunit p30